LFGSWPGDETAGRCAFGIRHIDAYEDGSVVMKEFFQKLKTRIHYAAPLVVARRVLSLFANRLTDPLLELRLRKVVVIDPQPSLPVGQKGVRNLLSFSVRRNSKVPVRGGGGF
jgi:hypothetical protein